MTEARLRGYTTPDFIPKTFWKRQKYTDRSHSGGCQGLATDRHWGVLGVVLVVM